MSELSASFIGTASIRLAIAVKTCWKVAAAILLCCLTIAAVIHGGTGLIDYANDRPISASHHRGS